MTTRKKVSAIKVPHVLFGFSTSFCIILLAAVTTAFKPGSSLLLHNKVNHHRPVILTSSSLSSSQLLPTSYYYGFHRGCGGFGDTTTTTRTKTKRRRQPNKNNKRTRPTTMTTQLYAAGGTEVFVTAVDTFWKGYPYAAAAVTCGVKASAADLVAQKRQIRKERKQQQQLNTNNNNKRRQPRTDYLRNFAYILYGSIYQGIAQEFIYNHIYPILFGISTNIQTVLIKVAFNLLVQTTFITLPIAYATKALIYKYPLKEAFQRYKDDIQNHGLLKKYFMLWGPVQCLTFSIIPKHLRITFIAVVSFFWMIILSSIISKNNNNNNNNNNKHTTTQITTNDDVEVYECTLEDGETCRL